MKILDNLNPLSNRTDYVNACHDIWFKKVPSGIRNVTNPGFVSTAEGLEMMKSILKPDREFFLWEGDADLYNTNTIALRSNLH